MGNAGTIANLIKGPKHQIVTHKRWAAICAIWRAMLHAPSTSGGVLHVYSPAPLGPMCSPDVVNVRLDAVGAWGSPDPPGAGRWRSCTPVSPRLATMKQVQRSTRLATPSTRICADSYGPLSSGSRVANPNRRNRIRFPLNARGRTNVLQADGRIHAKCVQPPVRQMSRRLRSSDKCLLLQTNVLCLGFPDKCLLAQTNVCGHAFWRERPYRRS